MIKVSRKYMLIAGGVLALLFLLGRRDPDREHETARVERAEFEVWSTYSGSIQPQDARSIISRIRGSGILTEIIPDGTSVTQGMVIAKFDASVWEDDILEAEKKLSLAEADYKSLVKAKIPLETRELETKLMAAEQKLSDERQALRDTIELRADDLVPQHEVEQLEVKVKTREAEIEGIKKTMELTEQYLHPSAVQRAHATLTTSSNEYASIKKRIDHSVIRAPSAGIAVLKPAHFSGEYRSARVGDTVYYSQAFMTISDMDELIARCHVPEQELTHIAPGAAAVVRPIAFPGMGLDGHVVSVSSMAQPLPGSNTGGKYFDIVVKIDSRNASLKSDMSAQVSILSYKASNALLVPRSAVWWQDGNAYCSVRSLGRKSRQKVAVGAAGSGKIEILDGLAAGQRVIVK